MIIIKPNRKLIKTETYDSEGCSIHLFHKSEDGNRANRLMICDGLNKYEFLPSKGLSVGKVAVNGQSLLWEQPSDLYNPQKVDLRSNAIHINGNPAEGFMYIATFCAGVELLGLSNWGMPVRKAETGRLEILHGEAASIPVDIVSINLNPASISLEASFDFRSFKGFILLPWYKRGKKLFRVTRKVVINRLSGFIDISDSFQNVSGIVLIPEWGYHVTFRPEPGARYLVPSRNAQCRGGGEPPEGYTVWQPSGDDSQRIENGIIFKDLKYDINGTEKCCTSLLVYPDGRAICVISPLAPYFQTWFCSGGAGSKEFTWENGQPVLKRNWDGIGIEFGSNALDHDNNTDPAVPPEMSLNPGEIRTISFGFGIIPQSEAGILEKSITRYNTGNT
jgi:hypothetical protein